MNISIKVKYLNIQFILFCSSLVKIVLYILIPDTLTWTAYQNEVVDYIRNDLGLGDRFTDELIHHCIGIAAVNSVQNAELNVSSANECLIVPDKGDQMQCD